MNIDPGIICVRHCNSDVFAFELPNHCPLCRTDLSAIQDFPFRIPFPFARANQHPCCVVLRPTRGHFLCNYTNAADLHIGVTDSHGDVVAFDEQGLDRGPTDKWKQCLAVPGLLSQQLEAMQEEWDSSLKHLIKTQSQLWTANRLGKTINDVDHFIVSRRVCKTLGIPHFAWNLEFSDASNATCAVLVRFSTSYRTLFTIWYNEDSWNCYSFILTLLKTMTFSPLCKFAEDKQTFCEHVLLPHTTAAAKYISLFRKVSSQGVFVQAK